MCRACSTVGGVIVENRMFIGIYERKRPLGKPKSRRDDKADNVKCKYIISYTVFSEPGLKIRQHNVMDSSYYNLACYFLFWLIFGSFVG
jgi:hypothetical protein